LPLYASCTNFINADLIAQGVSPLRPEAAAVRAGRLMLEEIERYRKQGIDFSFETTLSGKTQLAVVKALKNTG
jgi:predicted ABC-type ATPase